MSADQPVSPTSRVADAMIARAMEKTAWRVPMFDLLSCLTDVVDWISPQLVRHHKEVAFIALNIAEELGWDAAAKQQLVMAGLLHDIGALSLKDRLDTLTFELATGQAHAEQGCLLLRTYPPLAEAARIIRYHHHPWQNGLGNKSQNETVPLASHLLHLADRVAVLVKRHAEILSQVEGLRRSIDHFTGPLFHPDLVGAFKRRSVQEAMWFDLTSPSLERSLKVRSALPTLGVEIDGLSELAGLFRRLIDFRSPFTATHSSGVAASSASLAGLLGLPGPICRLMRVAGSLHDLGKLGVPSEILDKPGKLTEEEFRTIRRHPFDTLRCLEAIEDFQELALWGALHHERLDGSGYPFHFKGGDLGLPVRIMSVADVFTAITEDRPYRKGMDSREARTVLETMAREGALDPSIVAVLCGQFALVDQARKKAQESSIEEYKAFLASLGRLQLTSPRLPGAPGEKR